MICFSVVVCFIVLANSHIEVVDVAVSDGNGSHFLMRFSVDSVKPHSILHPYNYTP